MTTATKTRVEFTTWGPGAERLPYGTAFAVMAGVGRDPLYPRADVVARSIARRLGGRWLTLNQDGVDDGEPVYSGIVDGAGRVWFKVLRAKEAQS